MTINMHAPWEINTYLKGVIDEKIAKLQAIHDRIQRVDVFLKMKDTVGPDDKLIELRLRIPQMEFFAQDTAESFEKAMAGVTDKVKVQILRKKEKQQHR